MHKIIADALKLSTDSRGDEVLVDTGLSFWHGGTVRGVVTRAKTKIGDLHALGVDLP
ncbi:hypothetical protein GCM10010151_38870 [Actinoallomurus spadix]|uniref:Uncharacterized protein n=1 Tax=Actinoallomurus spadix TaxID=79912 RepID=A0ABN0WSE6_9ACTN